MTASNGSHNVLIIATEIEQAMWDDWQDEIDHDLENYERGDWQEEIERRWPEDDDDKTERCMDTLIDRELSNRGERLYAMADKRHSAYRFKRNGGRKVKTYRD